jgi:hypothetical protein
MNNDRGGHFHGSPINGNVGRSSAEIHIGPIRGSGTCFLAHGGLEPMSRHAGSPPTNLVVLASPCRCLVEGAGERVSACCPTAAVETSSAVGGNRCRADLQMASHQNPQLTSVPTKGTPRCNRESERMQQQRRARHDRESLHEDAQDASVDATMHHAAEHRAHDQRGQQLGRCIKL